MLPRYNRPAGQYRAPASSKAGLVSAAKKAVLVIGLIVGCVMFVSPFVKKSYAQVRMGMSNASAAKISEFKIVIIADLDKQSKLSAREWHAPIKEGRLLRDDNGKYSVKWTGDYTVKSGHNEAGRGMELSELINFNGHLMTVDDRTGLVFEILMNDNNGDHEWKVAPRHVFSEGDGDVTKGMKFEWGTTKGGQLILGSFGKEYTNAEGAIVNTNNMWIDIMDADGRASREDWTERYNRLRVAAGASFPGYMIHEAGAWSEIMQKWVFLPRRVSSDPYDDAKDEKMGSNKILIADEDFSKISVREVGSIIPERGFSSFKFVPGTQDRVIVALKSAEFAETDTMTSFITVFTIDGATLMDETEIPDGYKYEGLEIFIP